MLEMLENKHHHADKIDVLIMELLSRLNSSNLEKVRFECPKLLLDTLNNTKSKMNIIGERVIYTNNLKLPIDYSVPNYEVWSFFEHNSISFLSEVMQVHYSDAVNFLNQMNEELPSQAEKMYTVYIVNNEPVGVVFPHIEPNTDNEGRIFWIGIHPNFVGKGLGKNLHSIGLFRLKNEFNAKSYLGMTQIDNVQMRKVMVSNGCRQHNNTVISLEYFADK